VPCMVAAMHAMRDDAHAGNGAGGKGGRVVSGCFRDVRMP